MQTTMNLLQRALKIDDNMAAWTKRLGLSKQALYNAENRQHLSPAIAGALADEIGEDPTPWIVVAALESERDSACKTRMLKRVASAARGLYLSAMSAARRVVSIRVHHTKHSAPRNAG